jgi:hypothetical protein
MTRPLVLRLELPLVAVMVAMAGCGESPSPIYGNRAGPAIEQPGPGTRAHDTRRNSSRETSTRVASHVEGDPDDAPLPSGLHADPDPMIRLAALEAWALEPGQNLNPVTFALVDPDERVRARAQELLEDVLGRL